MADLKKWISLSVLVGAAVVGGLWANARYQRSQIFVSTDNAYVKGHITAVASRIPGVLLELKIQDNQFVKAGEVIAEVDPRDTEALIANAQSKVVEASSALAANQAQIAQAKAQVEAVQSQKALAELEQQRLSALFARQSIPKQKLDHAESALRTATAALEAAQKQVAAAEGMLGVSQSKIGVAKAALEAAQLQRSYCSILAPCDGHVSKRMAEKGQVVAAGQPLLALVPLGQQDLWVEANYKETQLARVKPGQKVELRADANHEAVFHGTVESLAAGTGAMFSLLPPENATGNWVKVVQRLPVKIKLDPQSIQDKRLRLGLTVSAVIDTRETESSSSNPSK